MAPEKIKTYKGTQKERPAQLIFVTILRKQTIIIIKTYRKLNKMSLKKLLKHSQSARNMLQN